MCVTAMRRKIRAAMAAHSEHHGLAQHLRDLAPDWLFYRVIEEPVWLYILWVTVCVVLSAAIIYSILSGSVPCPDPGSGC